ncbi:MAG: 3-oxoacyl-[acyl-carrier-protein] reductase [Chloroflexota bacterium]|nr:3-oxoacyl-[acyl-carrier-protein] reductase [Dehalococcoidia bacterium]MDW8253998.1 3-oxoacyl-[acyl-carrier-protein] reductase [Chloroflexota bacterium]
MKLSLAGKAALVTGASRGLGRAIAIAFAEAGASVAVGYAVNAEQAAETADRIRAAGGSAILVQGDVAQPAEAERAVQQTVDAFGTIDILVNNAGITRDTLALRLSEEEWDAVVDTNLKGAFFCSKAALRTMIRRRSGRIINMTSVVGLRGNAGQANYAAAKAGIIGLTKALAREVGSRGITVNAIAPGFIDVGMTETLSEQQRTAVLQQIPLGRFGAAHEVAAVALFLASDAAGYLTGVTIPVDGGLAM